MYILKRKDKLIKILKKLFKKDKLRYEIVLKKILEISQSEDPSHYKNLSNEMKDFKRVHIDSSFVLIFKVDKDNKIIEFYDLQHHNNIYRNSS